MAPYTPGFFRQALSWLELRTGSQEIIRAGPWVGVNWNSGLRCNRRQATVASLKGRMNERNTMDSQTPQIPQIISRRYHLQVDLKVLRIPVTITIPDIPDMRHQKKLKDILIAALP